MTTASASTQFARLAQRIEAKSRMRRFWKLDGGISASMTALELECADGSTRIIVVREHGEDDVRDNPQVASQELRLLQALHPLKLRVPQALYADESRTLFSQPIVVLDYIDGTLDFAPATVDQAIRQMATHLARIHAVDLAATDLSFVPQQDELCERTLRHAPDVSDESLSESRIRATLKSAWPLPRPNEPVLLHGDYWPGNILWKDGVLVGVIDWETSAIGDPLADLANSRIEILWEFGIEAMHAFTDQYRSVRPIDVANLPYWDLFAALRPASQIAKWAGTPEREQQLRNGHEIFITNAFNRLG